MDRETAEELRTLRERIERLEARVRAEGEAAADGRRCLVVTAATDAGAGSVFRAEPVRVEFDEREGAEVTFHPRGGRVFAGALGGAVEAGSQYLLDAVNDRWVQS